VQCLAEPVQVGAVVLLAEEAAITVLALLHDMKRNFVEVDARAAQHSRRLAEIEPGPFSSSPILSH